MEVVEKVNNLESDVKILKSEFCEIKNENKEIKESQKKIEEKLNQNDKNTAVQFAKLSSEVNIAKDASVEVKHILIKKDAEEKERGRFNITQLIALLGIMLAALALFKK